MHDDLQRAAEELADRVLNPKLAESLPGTTEEHAEYVLELSAEAPKPPTPVQEAALSALAGLQAERAKITVDAAIEDKAPAADELAVIDAKIARVEELANPRR